MGKKRRREEEKESPRHMKGESAIRYLEMAINLAQMVVSVITIVVMVRYLREGRGTKGDA